MFLTALTFPSLLSSCAPETVTLQDTHVHGLAVDRGDSNRLYIATHDGLFAFTHSTDSGQAPELARVGRSRDDFMGFSVHPTDPAILFSSGHPKGGGNIGVQRSDDGGASWKRISTGDPRGPADFHAMIVHPANPDHVYGWYRLRIHRSIDGGHRWEILDGAPPEIFSFAGDPRDDHILYLGTAAGILRSTDRGETWTNLSPELGRDAVLDVETDPQSPDILLLLATVDHGLLRLQPSLTGSFTLQPLTPLPDGDRATILTVDPRDAKTLYALREGHALYTSSDGGRTWQRVI